MPPTRRTCHRYPRPGQGSGTHRRKRRWCGPPWALSASACASVPSASPLVPPRQTSDSVIFQYHANTGVIHLWAEKGLLPFIRSTICPEADSNVKREMKARSEPSPIQPSPPIKAIPCANVASARESRTRQVFRRLLQGGEPFRGVLTIKGAFAGSAGYEQCTLYRSGTSLPTVGSGVPTVQQPAARRINSILGMQVDPH